MQNIEISGVTGSHDELVKIFKKYGAIVRSLTIANSKIDDFTFREILKNSDSLETLVLSEVSIVKKLPAINPVSMRKLRSLTIYHCDWNILKFITAQVKCFDVKSYLDEGMKCSLINFLAQQYKLKELFLRGTSARTLFQQDDMINACNFALTKFTLDQDFGKNSDNVNWHITAFLSLHVDTLKNVEILGPHCDHINGFVIANIEHLDTLALDVRSLPKDLEFYDMLEGDPNMQLKELSLRGFFTQHEAIKRILLKYPKIEKLELNDWGNGFVVSEMMGFISRNFPQLKQLSITEISNGENLQFSALKNLSVTYIRNTGKLVQFIMKNASVDTVKVGLVYIGQITANFIDELKQLDHVKHLAFGGNGTALNTILDLMKNKIHPQTHLKSLELSLISDAKSNLNSAKGMKFYFPIAKSTKFELM